MERTPRFTLKSLGTAIRERLPSWLDFDLDTILRLAGEDITSETFIAILVLAIGISLCAGIVLYLLGVIEFKTILIIPLIFGGVCFAVIIPNANHNRKIVRVRLMEFIGRMLMVATSGVSNPDEAAACRAAKSQSLLGREMQFVTQQIDLGVPLYDAFYKHFYERLGIREAQSVSRVLRESSLKGTSIVHPLRQLYKTFCDTREYEADITLTRLATLAAMIGAATITIAALLMIAGPYALSIKDIMLM